jgi:SAM-dependent methyltransferase
MISNNSQMETNKITLDFDRIAVLPETWNHNQAYEGFLLKHLPPMGEKDALEIGCGAGGFTRQLACRFRHVLALDLSPCMIQTARERSRAFSNIAYRAADFMACELPAGRFGCVASIAALHHLPLADALMKMKAALHPGGKLIILDLYKPESPADFAASLLAVPVNAFLMLVKTGRLRQSAQARAAWREHARSDVYPTLSQVRQVCAAVLPGAWVTRRLLWRYAIIWPGTPPLK